MPRPIVLREVEPFVGDSYETANYRRCDICFESVADDICSRQSWRQMYDLNDGELTVCENCIPDLTTED